jgi:hypothetical protein
LTLLDKVRKLCLAMPEAFEVDATSYCLIAPKRLAEQVSTPPSL